MMVVCFVSLCIIIILSPQEIIIATKYLEQ